VVLQLRRTALLHALRAMPFKPTQPAAISSEQTFLLHGPVAVATEETKTLAPSATAANVTTALLVIVEPPYGRFQLRSIPALYHQVPRLRHACQREKVPQGCGDDDAARRRRAGARAPRASVPRYRGGLTAAGAVRRTVLHGAQHSSCQPTTRPQSGQRCW